MTAATRARTVMERCDRLAAFSEEPDRLTRPYGSESLRAAQDELAGWMRAAGLTVRRDPVGNLIGRYPGRHAAAKTLLLGSHLDTVPDAGKYDGPLGILIALAAIERLRTTGERPPFAVDVVAFADEEGHRFQTTYLGSRALAGSLDAATLQLTDAAGITLADAIATFDGDANALSTARLNPSDLLGYVECHIEQGPVLEARGLPVAVVSTIVGMSRLALRFTGDAGHAGTVPMARRRDALTAAAEFVLAVEAVARATDGLVATVGQLAVEPGASNVVPGVVALSLDVRHPDNAARRATVRRLHSLADAIGADRAVQIDWRSIHEADAVRMDAALSDDLARAIKAVGLPVHRLPSGAGHDAVVLAPLTPVAMLFVRCAGGISHHPAESVSEADVEVTIRTTDRFLLRLAADASS